MSRLSVLMAWPETMLLTTPEPENEQERLALLRSLNILDTPVEATFERVTRLLCRVLETPIAAVSLVDEDRQWFKSKKGLDVCQTPRQGSFCSYTIMGDEPLVIEDAKVDPRFVDNEFVAGPPYLRFYAGIPLVVAGDVRIGALFVCDTKTRFLEEEDLQFMSDLAGTVASEIRTRLLKRMYG